MSASSACSWFMTIFERMAQDPEKYRDIAHFIYGVCREIDFHPSELELDEALINWGLAQTGPNPDFGKWEDEPEETTLYLGCDYGEYPVVYADVESEPEDEE
jgi:hypothetical protein